jgi:hypothetical protein
MPSMKQKSLLAAGIVLVAVSVGMTGYEIRSAHTKTPVPVELNFSFPSHGPSGAAPYVGDYDPQKTRRSNEVRPHG